ncbi:hypothetical protein B484DRAFT_477170 [Ochromonadaceae sp. CCMP2298]|nr:hypothetical protein B484DRAFT_477170 [Ochromonadaceae sp. CCMP2298]
MTQTRLTRNLSPRSPTPPLSQPPTPKSTSTPRQATPRTHTLTQTAAGMMTPREHYSETQARLRLFVHELQSEGPVRSIERLVHEPLGSGYLYRFCQSQYCTENMSFLIEVDKYRDLFALPQTQPQSHTHTHTHTPTRTPTHTPHTPTHTPPTPTYTPHSHTPGRKLSPKKSDKSWRELDEQVGMQFLLGREFDLEGDLLLPLRLGTLIDSTWTGGIQEGIGGIGEMDSTPSFQNAVQAALGVGMGQSMGQGIGMGQGQGMRQAMDQGGMGGMRGMGQSMGGGMGQGMGGTGEQWHASHSAQVQAALLSIWATFLHARSHSQICMADQVYQRTLRRMASVQLYGGEVFQEAALDPIKTIRKDLAMRYQHSEDFSAYLGHLRTLLAPPCLVTIHVPTPTASLVSTYTLQQLSEGVRFTLAQVLEDRTLYAGFFRYLSSSFSSENLRFVRAVTLFRRFASDTREDKRAEVWAFKIYRNFIVPGSPYEICITPHIRRDLERRLATPIYSTFRDAEETALQTLRGKFVDFARTTEYASFSLNMATNYEYLTKTLNTTGNEDTSDYGGSVGSVGGTGGGVGGMSGMRRYKFGPREGFILPQVEEEEDEVWGEEEEEIAGEKEGEKEAGQNRLFPTAKLQT